MQNWKRLTFTRKKIGEPQSLHSKMELNSQSPELQQQNEQKLKDIMRSLTKITLSIAGIEKQMEKLDMEQKKSG